MLMTGAYPKTLHRSHVLDNVWVQLPLIVLLGVIVPCFAMFSWRWSVITGPTVANSMMASCFAAILTWYSLEKLRYFAKARRLSYVIPVTIATFAFAYAVPAVLRLPHSNTVGLVTLVLVLLIAFIIAATTRQGGVQQWLVPGGGVQPSMSEFDGPVFASAKELRELLAADSLNGAIVADLHYSHSPDWEKAIAEAAIHGVPVYHYRQILEMRTGQVHIDHLRENNFGSLIPNLAYTSLKRGIDIFGSLVLLPLLLPVFGVVAILIKLDSAGPVFFHQVRIGYRGKVFVMHKFRSMEVNAIPKEGPTKAEDAVTRDQDARITKLGAFIRRYRIDELPQIVNILKGEMSWIGPRPEAESLSSLYQERIPFYRYRHIVRPGITGWAQVNQGHVAAVDEVAEKLRYDFYYVRHISLWLDILIAMKTLRIVLGGFGAK